VVPIGTRNTLTVMATYNANVYYQADKGTGTCGIASTGPNTNTGDITGNACTSGALAVYGRYFGMTNDKSVSNQYAQDYYGYNRTAKQTDFEYIRLQSELAPGLTLDNRVYMYGYTNHTLSGQDGTGQTANTVVLTPGSKAVAGIPGYDKLNKYRTIGYIGEADYNFSKGRLRVGGWYETSDSSRHLIDYDVSTMQPNYIEKSVSGLTSQPPANVQYLQDSGWNQYQLFAEFEYRPVKGLSITPGVKYVHFTRSINAPVNQKSRAPLYDKATWTSTLPFVTANYAITSNWTTYFQFAKGMYVPDLSSFYSASPNLADSLSQLKPQTSTNYQFGTVYHGHKFALDADIYKIDVNNKIASPTTAGADSSLLVNIGTCVDAPRIARGFSEIFRRSAVVRPLDVALTPRAGMQSEERDHIGSASLMARVPGLVCLVLDLKSLPHNPQSISLPGPQPLGLTTLMPTTPTVTFLTCHHSPDNARRSCWPMRQQPPFSACGQATCPASCPAARLCARSILS
jgi:iron complex outermembrane receptor protein